MKKLLTYIILSVLFLCGCAGKEGQYRTLSQTEAKKMMETETDYIILDVRGLDEYAEGHIPDAICIPNETIGERMNPRLPDRDQLIFVYCRSGIRSLQAAEKLAKAGYTNIIDIGGIMTWPYGTITSEQENQVTNMLMLDSRKSGEKDGVTLEVTDYSEGELKAKLENHSGSPFEYGEPFALKYKENGEWKELEWPDGVMWTMIAYVLEDGETADISCHTAMLEPLKAGEYMLVKQGIEAYFSLVMSE